MPVFRARLPTLFLLLIAMNFVLLALPLALSPSSLYLSRSLTPPIKIRVYSCITFSRFLYVLQCSWLFLHGCNNATGDDNGLLGRESVLAPRVMSLYSKN